MTTKTTDFTPDTPARMTFAQLLSAIEEDSTREYAELAATNAWEAACDLDILADEIDPDTAERRAIVENLRAYAVELRLRVERLEAA